MDKNAVKKGDITSKKVVARVIDGYKIYGKGDIEV